MTTTLIRSHVLMIALALPLSFAVAGRNLIAADGADAPAARGDASAMVQLADNGTPGNTGGVHDDNGKCGEGCVRAHNGN